MALDAPESHRLCPLLTAGAVFIRHLNGTHVGTRRALGQRMWGRISGVIWLAAMVAPASPASAQDVGSGEPQADTALESPEPERLSEAEYRDGLESIDREATAATVLYAIGVGLIVVGGLVIVGLLSAASTSSSSFISPAAVALVVGAPLGGLGLLILIPIAIALDIDSGSRRRGLNARSDLELTSVSVAPTTGGLTLEFAGRF